MKNDKNNGLPLSVAVRGGRIVIEIGIHTLAHAAAYADWSNPFNESLDDYIRTFAIADPVQFAKDVVDAMLAEKEDGSSSVSDFIDRAMEAALDEGTTGCEFEQTIKHGEHSPLEKWAFT